MPGAALATQPGRKRARRPALRVGAAAAGGGDPTDAPNTPVRRGHSDWMPVLVALPKRHREQRGCGPWEERGKEGVCAMFGM